MTILDKQSSPVPPVPLRVELDALQEFVLDGRIKGIPGNVPPFPLRDLAAKDWNVLREDLPLPLLVLKEWELNHNRSVFTSFLKKHQLSFAPHGKTTMAPQLFALQAADGAWAMTAATVNQIQVYRHYGIHRILLANQLLGRQNVRYIVEEFNADPDFDFYCFVDSVALVETLAKQARVCGLQRPLKALLEIGVEGGRTGCRTTAEALEVVRSIQGLGVKEEIVFAGVAGFEGVITIGPEAKVDDKLKRVDHYLMKLTDVINRLTADDFSGVEEIVLTAGGTAYFDRVAAAFRDTKTAKPVRVVLRSGCYLTHDSGIYRSFQDEALRDGRDWCEQLRPALEILSYVQSLPEPGLAILSMGKRDGPYDAGLPLPTRRFRPGEGWTELANCKMKAMNDQHAYLSMATETDLKIGDMVACGISHPCTAFDKWRCIPMINREYTVTGGVLTFF